MVAQAGIEGASNLPNQLVLREFIDSGAYAAHLRHLRDAYRDRREALLDIVRPFLGTRFEPELNPAGLRLVLRCSPANALLFASRLREQGVLCSTLSDLSASGVADDGIVLGFAAFPAKKSATAPRRSGARSATRPRRMDKKIAGARPAIWLVAGVGFEPTTFRL